MTAFFTPLARSDVCVVGGGPAGAVIAGQLAKLGRDVALVEAASFPRSRVAASLSAGILPLLDTAGIRDEVESAGFVRASPPLIRWPNGEMEGDPALWSTGFHVDRARFDHILLTHASRRGARVIQPARVTSAQRELDHGGWRLLVRAGGSTMEVTARVLVDASGRGVVSRRKFAAGPPLVAMYAYTSTPAGAKTAGRIAAGDSEWLWLAPASSDRFICEVFLDPKRLTGLHREGITALFRRLLASDALIAAWTAGCAFSRLEICDATSRAVRRHAEHDHLCVGDASMTIDPLSSQGVQVAMASALQAAAVVNTMLDGEAEAHVAAAFYEERQEERLALHNARAAAAYARVEATGGSAFWRDRARVAAPLATSGAKVAHRRNDGCPLSGECVLRLPSDVYFTDMPAIRNDRVVVLAAVHGAGLERPVVFLDRIPLADLLRTTRFNRRASAIAHDWQRRLPGDWPWLTLEWLWHHGVVVPHDDRGPTMHM